LKRKEAAAAAKAEARAEREVTNPTPSATPATQTGTATEDDSAAYAHLFGDYKIIQSTEMSEKVYREVSELTDAHIGQNIWLRGRLANSRAVGKGIFLVLRQHLSTAQAVMFQG
jgi:lysyl-tRNA synthetase class II